MNISGSWQGKKKVGAISMLKRQCLDMKVSVWSGFCIFSAFNCLWHFGQITSPPHLFSHLINQNNDSPLNSLFLRGWNKITCKIKYFRDLKTSSECGLVENNIGVLTCLHPFLEMKNLGTQVAFSSLLPVEVGTLEDTRCCGVWISGWMADWQHLMWFDFSSTNKPRVIGSWLRYLRASKEEQKGNVCLETCQFHQ